MANSISNFGTYSDSDIARVIPSVFATKPNALRSSKYTLFNTGDIIHNMRDLGYEVTNLAWNGTRKETTLNHPQTAKHMIRFSHKDFLNPKSDSIKVGQIIPQILLTNSHNGTSSYTIAAGLWRKVCSNGLCVSTGDIESYRIRHIGHSMDEVINASLKCAERTEEIVDAVHIMSGIKLNDKQIRDFVHEALKIKFGSEPKALNKVKTPMELIHRNRPEDAENTLWNIFNAAQENYIKGGIRLTERTLRPITNIEENTRINRELWQLADNFRNDLQLAVA